MKDVLRFSVFVLLIVFIAVGIVHNVRSSVQPVGWTELVLTALLVLTAIGDRFTKLRLRLTGLDIEQAVLQVTRTVDEVDALATGHDPGQRLADLVEHAGRNPRDVLSKLILIRMALRRMLRIVAESHRMQCGTTTSIASIVRMLLEGGAISEELAADVETIRNATFVAEWGAGDPPSREEIKFTLENYARVFQSLSRQRA